MHSLRWDSPLTQTGLCALCDPGRSAQICSSGHQRDPALADICGSPCGSWGFSWESLGCPTSLLPTEVFLQPSALLKQHQVVEGVVLVWLSRQPSPLPHQVDLISAPSWMGTTSFCRPPKKKEEIKTENLLLPSAAGSWLDLCYLHNSDIMC